VTVHGGLVNPPKALSAGSEELLGAARACAAELGRELHWEDTGGACDGNKLAAAGLPVIDTLGVCGGHLHAPNEFCHLPSLAERAALTALLLMRLASGAIRLGGRP
jgi:glutamate carboxypeptidase